MSRGPSSMWWFRGLLFAGALLAVALLTQTLFTYRYVSENLIRQEARRAAEETVRNVERAVRLARIDDAAGYQQALDDVREDAPGEVSSLLLFQPDGTIVASSGASVGLLAPEDRPQVPGARTQPLKNDIVDGQEVLVGVSPCRCTLTRSTARVPGPSADRLLLQIAVYRGSLSAPFARLRRNAIVGVTAALALLMAVGLIALHFGRYIQGKQLEGQLALARQVQRALLPPATAWPQEADAAATCLPASQVGGDFYEIASVPDGRLLFSLGDVSGHGMPAALLMGMLHGAMSDAAGRVNDGLEVTAARLNDLLLKKSSGERFASMIACLYDPRAGRLRYVNAGHPPGLLISRTTDGASRLERLVEGGPVLGLLRDAQYRTAELETHDGDLVVLFSDGVVETMNRGDDYYGEGRLAEVIERHRDRPADAICAEILSSVLAFSERQPALDDRSILVLKLWRAAAATAEAA